MDLTIDLASNADREVLTELHRGIHPDGITLVARAEDRIIGMVLMTHFDDGVHRYGILHVLEVDQPRAKYAREVASALVNACRIWLEKRGTTQLLAAPQIDSWLILEDLRSVRSLRAVKDDQFQSDLPPGVVRVARHVWV